MTDENKLSNVDFDLFAAIEACDRKDYGYFSRLTPEQQNKFAPFMMLQWMATTKSNTGRQTRRTDFYANRSMLDPVFNGKSHLELQWLMLCAAGQGSKQFHQWVPELKKSVRDLVEPAKSKDVSDYFSKIYKGIAAKDLKDITTAFIAEHEHKRRIKALYPDMKMADVEALAKIVTPQELNQREHESGE